MCNYNIERPLTSFTSIDLVRFPIPNIYIRNILYSTNPNSICNVMAKFFFSLFTFFFNLISSKMKRTNCKSRIVRTSRTHSKNHRVSMNKIKISVQNCFFFPDSCWFIAHCVYMLNTFPFLLELDFISLNFHAVGWDFFFYKIIGHHSYFTCESARGKVDRDRNECFFSCVQPDLWRTSDQNQAEKVKINCKFLLPKNNFWFCWCSRTQ